MTGGNYRGVHFVIRIIPGEGFAPFTDDGVQLNGASRTERDAWNSAFDAIEDGLLNGWLIVNFD